MVCKGICVRHRAQKPPGAFGRYATGQKRCQVCEMFLKWDGMWCPCCGYRVRTRPRGHKFKERLRIMNQKMKIKTVFEAIAICGWPSTVVFQLLLLYNAGMMNKIFLKDQMFIL